MSLAKREIIFCMLLICLYPVNLQAQDKHDDVKQAYFSGKIEGRYNDTIELHFYPSVIYAMLPLEHSVYVVNTDNYGLFKLKIPEVPIKGSRISMLIKSGGQIYPITSSYYLLEPGDSIYMSIVIENENKLNVTFSGRGKIKYICQMEVDVAMKEFSDSIKKEDQAIDFYTENNMILLNNRLSFIKSLIILDQYKNQISPYIFKLMKAEILGEAHLIGIIELIRFYEKADKTQKENVIKLYHQLFNRHIDNRLENILPSSYNYINFLLCKIGHELTFKQSSYGQTLSDYYSEIKSEYSGLLGEMLLVSTLEWTGNRASKGMSTKSVDSLWNDAFRFIHNQTIKEYISKRISHKSKGSISYKFSLSDSKGNIISLADLKGKVILIDFWFTGCGGCMGYSWRLEKYIYPEFKDNTEVVFVSVCGDKNRAQWLKSIKEGKYTREENINLFTEGMGFDHPFTKYYDFNGGPYSLLIDKNGKIFSGNPPTNDMKALITLIKEAMKQD